VEAVTSRGCGVGSPTLFILVAADIDFVDWDERLGVPV
jgi:hypothetical protein